MISNVIVKQLARYGCETPADYDHALKELMQEVALLGLWRAHFFEAAAFYGGTALRILYGLDRFSEDLDFSLLEPNSNFSLLHYNAAVISELSAHGFDVEIQIKKKPIESVVQSAFIKGNTLRQMIRLGVPESLQREFHVGSVTKVKLEVDTDPPAGAHTETRSLLFPAPYFVTTYRLPDLFAGKLHAILCRSWNKWVKGRDWHDFIWLLQQDIPVNLEHLRQRLVQSGHLNSDSLFSLDTLKESLREKIASLDVVSARNDGERFLHDPRQTAVWSKEFFEGLLPRLRAETL